MLLLIIKLKNYFRSQFQRFGGYCHGTWFSEELAIQEAKDNQILDYEIHEINITTIHKDFERIYDLKDKDFELN